MTPFENLPPKLQRRLKRSRAKLLAAIADCFGADSPLLALFCDNSELTPEQIGRTDVKRKRETAGGGTSAGVGGTFRMCGLPIG